MIEGVPHCAALPIYQSDSQLFQLSSEMMDDSGVELSNEEADSMAMAAAEAAAAAEEQEQMAAAAQHQPQYDRMICRICGKGPDDDGRPLCRFLPTDNSTAGIVTFGQDISLHVFCGKTASILPNINQPDLEILSKAGIKNKHGIGPEVNGALARTRSSTIAAEGAKEKTFYIVKEFEAHLAAIRSASMAASVQVSSVESHGGLKLTPFHHVNLHHSVVPLVDHSAPLDPAFDPLYHNIVSSKAIPHKAGHSYQKRDPWADVTITPDGKIRCGCGGTHLPTGTAKGDASWRSHVMTKRHQKWMEDNGLLGAV